jgi:K+-transporting ATPase ATPase C chain
MVKTFSIALRTALVTLLLTGIVYPLAVTGLARLLFPAEAAGSFVIDENGRIVGSDLIGQRFTSPAYFWSRPSAAGAGGYDGAASGGSNLGPTSRKLRERIVAETVRLKETNPDADGPVPIDLVTASASGLDPHISPGAALWQAPRVAVARGVAVERVRSAIESQIEGRDLGFLGEPRVNVLRLNLLVDRLFGRPPAAARKRG